MTGCPCVARELALSPNDSDLLKQFYDCAYVSEFPDPDERESLANMERYLQLKAEGWYGRNNYHILLFLVDAVPIGGSIIDYLAEPNVGMIEFLTVSSSIRQNGLGRRLLEWTEAILDEDSRRAGYDGLAYVMGEMNDPFKSFELEDSMDPFARAMIWDRWGYKKTRFPYHQPALSPEQQPVTNLLLMCKPGPTGDPNRIPVLTVKQAVHGYAIWAMRIEDPDTNRECREMRLFLEQRSEVELLPLATYVGNAEARRLSYADLTVAGVEDLDGVLDIYASEFSEGPTSFPRDLFKQSLLCNTHQEMPYAYHLLSIKTDPAGPPAGMASFFTFPGAGFGGYVVLGADARGKGHFSEIMTVIERTMVIDKRGALGWYGECDPADGSLPIMKKRGFHGIDIEYRQPPLAGRPAYCIEEAPVLHLIYKEFGDTFSPQKLSAEDFLSALSWVLRVIYHIDFPEESEYYLDVKRQLGDSEFLSWK